MGVSSAWKKNLSEKHYVKKNCQHISTRPSYIQCSVLKYWKTGQCAGLQVFAKSKVWESTSLKISFLHTKITYQADPNAVWNIASTMWNRPKVFVMYQHMFIEQCSTKSDLAGLFLLLRKTTYYLWVSSIIWWDLSVYFDTFIQAKWFLNKNKLQRRFMSWFSCYNF